MKGFLSISLLSCLLVAGASQVQALDVSIFQNDVETMLEDKDASVELKAMPFAIRYTSPAYSSQSPHTTLIVASTDDAFFSEIEIGRPIRDVSFFSNGSKITAPLSGYEFLMLQDSIHHQLFFVPSQSPNPVKALEQHGADFLLEWEVNALRYNGATQALRTIDIPRIFVLVFSDTNLNALVDDNELVRVELTF